MRLSSLIFYCFFSENNNYFQQIFLIFFSSPDLVPMVEPNLQHDILEMMYRLDHFTDKQLNKVVLLSRSTEVAVEKIGFVLEILQHRFLSCFLLSFFCEVPRWNSFMILYIFKQLPLYFVVFNIIFKLKYIWIDRRMYVSSRMHVIVGDMR